MFINPIKDGYLTSKFGWRTISKVKEWHQGVDLSRRPNTNVEILASADGEVIATGLLGSEKSTLRSYGNVVMIRHKINGKIMETNYAHLSKVLVKKGQVVKQGDVIGIMGNTGRSTAPHLHFEIHDGIWVSGQKNAVDPSKYIEFFYEEELKLIKKQIDALTKQFDDLTKAYKLLEAKQNVTYNRNVPSDWAKVDIEYAKNTKPLPITDGTRLDAPITREEAIALVVRGIKNK